MALVQKGGILTLFFRLSEHSVSIRQHLIPAPGLTLTLNIIIYYND